MGFVWCACGEESCVGKGYGMIGDGFFVCLVRAVGELRSLREILLSDHRGTLVHKSYGKYSTASNMIISDEFSLVS